MKPQVLRVSVGRGVIVGMAVVVGTNTVSAGSNLYTKSVRLLLVSSVQQDPSALIFVTENLTTYQSSGQS